MSLRNRTNEFHSTVDLIQSRQHQNAAHNEKLLRREEHSNVKKSEFSQMAALISREIASVSGKLDRLGKCTYLNKFLCSAIIPMSLVARSKTLFDDRPVEIQELTHVIKTDIARLNENIARLDKMKHHLREGNGTAAKQLTDHSNVVVVALQTELAKTSKELTSVLELRTEVL